MAIRVCFPIFNSGVGHPGVAHSFNGCDAGKRIWRSAACSEGAHADVTAWMAGSR